MIQMRTARAEDAAAVSALWGEVFGDDEAFLRGFFARCAPFEGEWVLEEDGAVQTILTAPRLTVRLPDGAGLSAGYMYALATWPHLRGRGFGRDMMNFGAERLAAEGADCAVLVPAEPSLFRFFDSLDYTPAFSHLRRELAAAELPDPETGDALAPAGAAEYNELRRRWLEGRLYLDCTDDLIAFQRELAEGTCGGLWRLELPGGAGCAVTERDGDTLYVKELLCAEADSPRAAALLAAKTPAKRVVLRLPPWWEGPGERVTWGAVRHLSSRSRKVWPQGEDGWLGIALD